MAAAEAAADERALPAAARRGNVQGRGSSGPVAEMVGPEALEALLDAQVGDMHSGQGCGGICTLLLAYTVSSPCMLFSMLQLSFNIACTDCWAGC